jgi:AraC family transcriptional regulator
MATSHTTPRSKTRSELGAHKSHRFMYHPAPASSSIGRAPPSRTGGRSRAVSAEKPPRHTTLVPAEIADGARVWWSAGCDAHPTSLAVCLRSYPAGRIESPASPNTWVAILVGRSVRVSCRGDGLSHRGVAVAGDVHVVPAGMPTLWETQGTVTSLFLRVPAALLERVAGDAESGAAAAEIAARFLTRDPQIEHIGWALKAEIENGSPNGSLFRDSLGTALASHLLVRHSSRSVRFRPVKGGLPGPKLKRLLTHIEDNLDGALTLGNLADVAGLSASHLKALFRQSMGIPVHQYVVRRRVERATTLLRSGNLSSSEVALATGFAHQSHLARQMRRLLGVTPTAVRKGRN